MGRLEEVFGSGYWVLVGLNECLEIVIEKLGVWGIFVWVRLGLEVIAESIRLC